MAHSDSVNKILDATESVNDLLCTNFTMVDYSKEYGCPKLLPVNCENGLTQDEINGTIEELSDKIYSSDYMDKSPPYCMSKEALVAFKNHFSPDDDDDNYYYTSEDVLRSMVPGQTGLIENITRLMNFYGVDDDCHLRSSINRIADTCENPNCCAYSFVRFENNNCDDGNPPPPPRFPKLRNPFTYRFDEKLLFENTKAAKEYLERLNNSLAFEETKQCVVCDIIQFFFNKMEEGRKDIKLFDWDCLPNVHPYFYSSLSTHVLITKNNIFSKTTIRREENGRYTVRFNEKIYC